MTVLHILLGILKIAGILLGFLLGILLLILICLLFCPVVYQGGGEKNSDFIKGNLKISWLFRGISLKIWYEEGTHLFCTDFRYFHRTFKRQFLKDGQERKKKKSGKQSLLPYRMTVGQIKRRNTQGKVQKKLSKMK